MIAANNEVEMNNNISDGVSIKLLTPDGIAYVNINESKPGNISRIFFNVGRAGTPVNAWGHCVGELVNELIKENKSLNDILIILSNITSQRSTRSINGIECRSGPDALFIALMKYRAMTPKEDNNYRPAKFNRRRGD